MKSLKNAIIVGCGKIAGLDESLTGSQVNTHAKALKKNSFFNLISCVDKKKKNLIKFRKRWSIKNMYLNIPQETKNKIDLAIICTPTNIHKKSLLKIFDLKPNLILCEKPMSNNIFDIKEIIKKKPKNIDLLINYNRRSNIFYTNLKKNIRKKKFGELRSITAEYNKGLMNNGSHLIDLLHFLLGNLSFVAKSKPIFDYQKNDPSYSFLLKSGKVNISVNTGNSKDFYLFNLKFIFSKKIIEITENEKKINYLKIKRVNSYKKYNDLILEKSEKFKRNSEFQEVYKNLERQLKGKKVFLTNIYDELKNQKLIKKIL